MSDEMIRLVLDEAADKMAKSVAHTRHEFGGVRTGRANSGLVDKMMVEYYGAEVPMQQLAGFSVPEARQLLITPYDKGAMEAIEKTIRASDLGLNPSNDGNAIRLVFPPLTEERRKELVKVVRHMAEEGKVALRNERRRARHDLDVMKKDGEISDDDLQRSEKELDKLTHTHESQIDEALKTKEAELLEV
jgi:ribosome recycling factor